MSRKSRTSLRAEELALWQAIKKISATTTSVMRGEIGPNVTGADYSILSRLDEIGGMEKTLGQAELMKSLGWDKSRLSHQLTRMEKRGLVQRQRLGQSVEIVLQADGAHTLAAARPLHAAAIRRYMSKLNRDEANAILSLAAKL
jgi:DNA-binding MarR family transcriptional regulator